LTFRPDKPDAAIGVVEDGVDFEPAAERLDVALEGQANTHSNSSHHDGNLVRS